MLVPQVRKVCLSGGLLALVPSTAAAQGFNYAEVLQKSMFFYEVQRSGPLAPGSQITWREDSGLDDGLDVGHDLTGGWYDAGDHVKFGFPMAYSATTLAWGALDFRDGYLAAGQLEEIEAHLRHVNDYFLRCHTRPEEFWGQVGNGSADHSWWGSAEVMQMERPAYKIDAKSPGSDLAAETAAAMAAASMLFATSDPSYSSELLSHALGLYQFADDHRGVYSDSIQDAQQFYKSFSGYQDELCWGAIWLYRATDDVAWLDRARSEYLLLTTGPSGDPAYSWGLSWDDKSYGCYALMARLTGEASYREDIERHLDYWTTGYGGSSVTYTPGGLAWLDQWGSLRYACNTAFLALYHHDIASTPQKQAQYHAFARSQIDYALGSNPQGRSYVCGFGVNPPVNPHHRTAHGAWGNNVNGDPVETRHILYGALVGGPDNLDGYSDDRDNYINNEVACDYNALFSGALAKLTLDFGGTPLVNFPPVEEPTGEYMLEVGENLAGDTFTEVSVWVHNRTAWPARIPSDVRFRIFVNLSEGYSQGLDVSDYFVSTNQSTVVMAGPLQLWDPQRKIFFTELSFGSELFLWPGGTAESSEEAQVRLGLLSAASPPSAWNPYNDPSFLNLTGTHSPTHHIPMYVDGELVWGFEPPIGGYLPAADFPFVPGGGWPSLTLDVDRLQFDQPGGSAQVNVTSNLSWTASDDQNWITVIPAAGSGDGTFRIVAEVNPGLPRLGTVTVTAMSITREVSVLQAGDPNASTCEDPVPVALPFDHSGAGEYCWAIEGDVEFINSWDVDILEVNGVDLSNAWVSGSNLPPKINDRYFVRFVGSLGWSHFEAVEQLP
jgi:endoglucanase